MINNPVFIKGLMGTVTCMSLTLAFLMLLAVFITVGFVCFKSIYDIFKPSILWAQTYFQAAVTIILSLIGEVILLTSLITIIVILIGFIRGTINFSVMWLQ